jgi:hypothetical protein
MGGLETLAIALTKREPKTPMAFFNKALYAIAAVGIAPLYSNLEPWYKIRFVITACVFIGALLVWISIYSWFKPQHLLYGAESHLEKWRLEYAASATSSGAGATVQSGQPNQLPPPTS